MRKWIILLVLAVVSCYTHAQLLYQSYGKEGVTSATGGPKAYRIEIKLRADSCFVYQMTVYRFKEANGRPEKIRTTLSEDVNTGKWFVKQDTLFLDYNPESMDAQNQLDMYLIKRKRLKRITKTERAIFHASGELLSMHD